MPHVNTTLQISALARGPRASFGDPALWAWIVVAVMAALPLRSVLIGG